MNDTPISAQKPKDRRLLYEYNRLQELSCNNAKISCDIMRRNSNDLPVQYRITYNIRSICSVQNIDQLCVAGITNPPIFADKFVMTIDIPSGYPSIDAQPVYRFLTHDDDGNSIPHPWHPNIRYFGEFSGRVCLNATDTYTDIAQHVLRIASYLRYERYHALNEPPYPEDQLVAAWVIRQAEANGWVPFRSENS